MCVCVVGEGREVSVHQAHRAVHVLRGEEDGLWRR